MLRPLHKDCTLIRYLLALIIILVLPVSQCFAQGSCPLNIDFELGNFQGWQCYTGSTSYTNTTNQIFVTPAVATPNIHTIVAKSAAVDPYGKFPISAPDGSGYSVRLGNSGTGAQAERLTYNFTVPADQPNFSMTYQYAVVLQDGGHVSYQQPRFTAKVLDIASNTYIGCSSFDYVATSGLPGFTKSLIASDVVYKAWTPVTIDLSGMQGKQIRIEFTTADCTVGGHFGYAYVDINKACTNLVTGNEYCPGSSTVTVKGPAGFDKYKWYNADKSVVLGTTNPLLFGTPPPDGTVLQLELTPFAGFGCANTVSVVMRAAVIGLTVTNPPPLCLPGKADITSASVVSLIDKTAILTYWTDAACTSSLADPTNVIVSGTYYIKATNAIGCTEIKPVIVNANRLPNINVVDPPPLCNVSSYDITAPTVVSTTDTNLDISYWQDVNATQPLANPNAITVSGTYYVRAINTTGCVIIKPIKVIIVPAPKLIVNPSALDCILTSLDITAPALTAGSDADLTLSYWLDANATIPLANPTKLTVSGTYYIKGVSLYGCVLIKPVTLIISFLPTLIVTNPPAICAPNVVDLTAATITTGSINVDSYTYWADAAATTTAIPDPKNIKISGTYYIKASNNAGCFVIRPVVVIVNPVPIVKTNNPATVCDLSKVDITLPAITAGSAPGLTYTYWKDAAATQALLNPKTITAGGTYYIQGTNANGCSTVAPVNVTFFPLPVLTITDPPSVCFPETVSITTEVITAGSDADITLSYWQDANATIPLANTTAIAASNIFYIRAINANGCQIIKPVVVTVNPLPTLVINNPPDVCYPGTVNLAAEAVTAGSTLVDKLTYWRDANATIPLDNYRNLADSGRYYIKAVSIYGCSVINTVLVSIHLLPVLKITPPKKIYEPAVIDLTSSVIVKGSSPNLKFSYYTDASLNVAIDRPYMMKTTGTYYIKAENEYGCYSSLPVEITVALRPDIILPRAFTPGQSTNSRLYPFLIGMKSFTSLIIYNRWGNIVFQTTNASPDKGWDGIYKGVISFLDTYTWVSDGYDTLGNPVHRTGNTIILK